MLGPDRLMAGGAGDGLVKRRATAVVHEERGRTVHGVPPVAPTHQGNKSRGEVCSLGGEAVLVAYRSVLVGDAVHDLELDQALQPVGEEVSGDAEVQPEVLEAAHPTEQVTQDEQGPTVADGCEGGCDGTVVTDDVVWHLPSVAVSCYLQLSRR